MSNTKGYIYIRTNNNWDKYNVCKLSHTDNLHKMDVQYANDSEFIRGRFVLVFEVYNIYINHIKQRLPFHKYNIRRDGGHDFYDKKIITLIESQLSKCGFPYKKLSEQEIINLVKGDIVESTNKIQEVFEEKS